MDGKSTQLPWEALQHQEGSIPWPALREFADAVVTDPAVVDELVSLYEQVFNSAYDRICYADIYVPAIFALAAPRLNEDRRRQIGTLLVEKLAEAGREDADLLMEVLLAACGSMGPVILPAVLDAIAKEPDMEGAWFHLWGLTELAAKTDNTEIRSRVIMACRELLQQVDRGEIDCGEALEAAWTVALLKCTDCEPLLRRVKNQSIGTFCHVDYAEALELLRGHLDYLLPPSLWEEPVEEWLEPRWQWARDWYTKQAEGQDEDNIDMGIRRSDLSNSQDFSPPIPIVEHSSRIGRNQPCPCGSGKKYKKCCGSVKT